MCLAADAGTTAGHRDIRGYRQSAPAASAAITTEVTLKSVYKLCTCFILAVAGSGSFGCAANADEIPNGKTSSVPASAPHVIPASAATRTNVGIDRYEVQVLPGVHYVSTAFDGSNDVVGVVEARGLNRDTGEPETEPFNVGLIQLDVLYPGSGTVIVDIETELPTETSVDRSSFDWNMLEALRLDFGRAAAEPADASSADHLGELQAAQTDRGGLVDTGGLIPLPIAECVSRTRCVLGAVQVCEIRCCEAIDAITLQPALCERSVEPCGICFRLSF